MYKRQDVRGYAEIAMEGDIREDWCWEPRITLGCSDKEECKSITKIQSHFILRTLF